jgi:glycosyltransferase involved in cell wall biosynthesis
VQREGGEAVVATSRGPASERATVAIVVPNYNHARFLPESLGSIAGQSRAPDEVLIIDDCSTDDSCAVIESFLSRHPNWRLIRHTDRQGVVQRQNEALSEVRSDWITFLGADDLLDRDFLVRATDLAARHPAAGLVCGCVEVFGASLKRSLRPPILPRTTPGFVTPGDFRRLLGFGDNYFLGTGSLYRRAAVLDLGGFDRDLGSISDSFVSRQLAGRLGFGFVPEVFGFWRIHGQNYSVSTVTDPQRLEDGLRSVHRALGKEPAETFPADYRSLLSRRIRFGGIRLIALDRSGPAAARASRIAALLSGGALERQLLTLFLKAGVPGSILALAWASMRLRPFSLTRLLRHSLVRRAIVNRNEPPGAVLPAVGANIRKSRLVGMKAEGPL